MAELKPLFPPEEKFWKRYSPRNELPLATAVSFLLHGAGVALLVFGFLSLLLRPAREAGRPPNLDVVMVGAPSGDGLPEGGGVIGDPNGDGSPGKVEPPKAEPKTKELEPKQVANADVTPPDAKATPDFPVIDLNSLLDTKVAQQAIELAKEIEKKMLEAMNDQPKKNVNVAMVPKVPGPKGTGGQGTKGTGTGKGNKSGPGTGKGGMAGRAATKQEVYAWRWRFDLAGTGREHAEKLAAIGVTLAMEDPRGGYLIIQDLHQRPVRLVKDRLVKFKDAVKWYNTKSDSLQALAQELRLPFTPRAVILLLPKDREEKMAAEEARLARQQNRDLSAVTGTWFDFRLVNGVYEPVALRFE